MKITTKNLYQPAFEPDAPKRIDCIKVEYLFDDCDDHSYLEQEGFEERLQAYDRGDFHHIGIRAIAEVSYPSGNGLRRFETLASGGLWGIESDSDESYLLQIEQEETHDLLEHVHEFCGIPKENMPVLTDIEQSTSEEQTP